MMSVEESLYNTFGNFFRIEISKLGDVFELGEEIDESIDRNNTIHYRGKYFSFIKYAGSKKCALTNDILERFVRKQFSIKLKTKGFKFRGKYCAYSLENEVKQNYGDIFRVFNGLKYRIVTLNNELFLCLDPHVVLNTTSSITTLIEKGISPSELNNFSVHYLDIEGFRVDGHLIDTTKKGSAYICSIKRYRKKEQEPIDYVPAEKVLPEPRPELIQKFLNRLSINYNVIWLQRRLSFLDVRTSSKDRFLNTRRLADGLKEQEIFPLTFGDFEIDLKTKPPIIIKL